MSRLNKGFSLIEILVGLAIGMIAMLVIAQTFTVFEGQKRTTTGGSDALTSGAIALYMIEKDVRMAGWGMGSSTFSGCDAGKVFTYCDGSEICGGSEGPISNFTLNSVTITDGGANPDTITAQFFANPNFTGFNYAASTKLSRTMPNPSSELDVDSVNGCKVGDMILVAQAGTCTLMELTTIQETALKIQHNKGVNGNYNPSADYLNANNWPAYTKGASLSCFAPGAASPTYRRIYSIDLPARQLRKFDNSNKGGVVTNEIVAPEILDLQAQYGIASPALSQVVNSWVDATGAWANPGGVTRNQIKAVRIAVVARSSQYERPETGKTCSTTPAPATKAEDAAAWSAWAKFDTTKYPADWQCYRYKVFETVVPLRNVLWAKI